MVPPGNLEYDFSPLRSIRAEQRCPREGQEGGLGRGGDTVVTGRPSDTGVWQQEEASAGAALERMDYACFVDCNAQRVRQGHVLVPNHIRQVRHCLQSRSGAPSRGLGQASAGKATGTSKKRPNSAGKWGKGQRGRWETEEDGLGDWEDATEGDAVPTDERADEEALAEREKQARKKLTGNLQTSKATLGDVEVEALDEEELWEVAMADPEGWGRKREDEEIDRLRERFPEMRCHMHAGRNVLVYGVGSKIRLLNKFAEVRLRRCDSAAAISGSGKGSSWPTLLSLNMPLFVRNRRRNDEDPFWYETGLALSTVLCNVSGHDPLSMRREWAVKKHPE